MTKIRSEKAGSLSVPRKRERRTFVAVNLMALVKSKEGKYRPRKQEVGSGLRTKIRTSKEGL